MTLTAKDLLGAVTDYGDKAPKGKVSSADKPNRLATVAVVSGAGATVTFDGEDNPSGKTYAVLGSYSPTPSDRVLLVPVGTSYAIVGAVAPDPTAQPFRRYYGEDPGGTPGTTGLQYFGGPIFTPTFEVATRVRIKMSCAVSWGNVAVAGRLYIMDNGAEVRSKYWHYRGMVNQLFPVTFDVDYWAAPGEHSIRPAYADDQPAGISLTDITFEMIVG